MAVKALISGGGIGGLCAALCLDAIGWQVEIFEQSAAINEIGAGIQLSPNAMQVMQALGLSDALLKRAFRPVASQMRDGVSGKVFMSSPMGSQMERNYGAPYLHIHRADLIAVLHDAVQERMPNAIHLHSPVMGYDSKRLNLSNGTTVSGDLVIGADGIKSLIAKQLFASDPQNIAPQFTGNVAWRAVVPVERLGRNIPPPAASVWMGAGKHAVTYLLRSGKLANFVGVVESDETIEDWHNVGSKEDALADFKGWHPIITTLIEQADAHHRWALYERSALPRWHDDSAVIIGDAAHAMLPFVAQGAAMAIEDGYALSQMLSTHPIESALEHFYDARIKRTSKVQTAARANMDLFHSDRPTDMLKRDSSLWLADKLSGNRAANMKMDWIYGYDVTKEHA